MNELIAIAYILYWNVSMPAFFAAVSSMLIALR
jgi:hypothetical protein